MMDKPLSAKERMEAISFRLRDMDLKEAHHQGWMKGYKEAATAASKYFMRLVWFAFSMGILIGVGIGVGLVSGRVLIKCLN